MSTVELNTKIVGSYLEWLESLGPTSKLELIGKLTESIKLDLQEPKDTFEESFGAWDEGDDAEELVAKIRDSRMLSRITEEL